jgi:hypothetical protein
MYKQLSKNLFVGLFIIGSLAACSESAKPVTAITVLDTDISAFQKPNVSVKYSTFDKTKFTAALTEGENQTWDFTTYKSSTSSFSTVNYLAPQANTSFKTATYAEKYVSKILNLDLNVTDYREITATGFYILGSQIDPTPLALGGGIVLTPSANDNSWVSKRLVWKFPMVYKDNYSSEHSVREGFRLTAPPFGLNNAPTERLLSVKQQMEVVGWGKLILPSDAGTATSDVLLIKVTNIATLNYFLGGNPAPPALLNALGLTQGEVRTSIIYDFVAKSSGNLATVIFDTDATGKIKFPPNRAYYIAK